MTGARKTTPSPCDGDRLTPVVNVLRTLVLLRSRRMTVSQLAQELGVSPRTVRRYLIALQRVPFPVSEAGRTETQEIVYGLGSMKEWPRCELVMLEIPWRTEV